MKLRKIGKLKKVIMKIKSKLYKKIMRKNRRQLRGILRNRCKDFFRILIQIIFNIDNIDKKYLILSNKNFSGSELERKSEKNGLC